MVALSREWLNTDEDIEVYRTLKLAAQIAQESDFSINEVLLFFKGQESMMELFRDILRTI